MEDPILHEKAAEPEELTLVCDQPLPTYTIITMPASNLGDQYKPMVYSRWLRSLRYGNNLFKKISSNEYYKSYHAYIDKLMEKPDSLVRLAVLSDDHDVVLGFSVSREDVLDYIHVHSDYRRVGIARSLLSKRITTFTHLTSFAITVWQGKDSKYKHLKFNPRA